MEVLEGIGRFKESSTSLVYPGVKEVYALRGDGPGEAYGWMTGVKSVHKVLKGLSRIRPYA